MKFILILFLSLQCFAQHNIEVIYKYQSNFKKEIPGGLMGEILLKSSRQLPELNFTLKATPSKSLYSLEKKVSNDASSQRILKLMLSLANSKGIFFSDIEQNVFKEQINAFGKLYKIISDFDQLQWNISNEKKSISGYQCQRATLEFNAGNENNKAQNKEIIAWFATELNYPFGPLGYRGLPGLIIELNVNWDYGYILKVEKIKFLDNILEIEEPDEGEIISEMDFKKLSKNSKFEN